MSKDCRICGENFAYSELKEIEFQGTADEAGRIVSFNDWVCPGCIKEYAYFP